MEDRREEEGREEGEEGKGGVMKYIPAVQALIPKCSIDDECCTCQLRIQLSSTMVNFLYRATCESYYNQYIV